MEDFRKIFYDKFIDSGLNDFLISASMKVQVCAEAFFKKNNHFQSPSHHCFKGTGN